MIGKVIANKKYRDYYSFRNWECKISIVLTTLIVISLTTPSINIYGRLDEYIPIIQNITIYLAAGLLAMIGVILAGIALILSLLDKKFRDSIKDISEKDLVREIMGSFEFLVLNLGISSILFFILYFLTATGIYVEKYVFYFSIFIIIYYVLFLIFYTIALIGNTIELYFIKDLYEEIEHKDKTLYERANEVRIDYLLRNGNINSKEEFILELECIIDSMDMKDKESVKKYLRNYYD